LRGIVSQKIKFIVVVTPAALSCPDTVRKVEKILQKTNEDEKIALRRGSAGISINGVYKKYTGKPKATNGAKKKAKPEKKIPSEPTRSTEVAKIFEDIQQAGEVIIPSLDKIKNIPHDPKELKKFLDPIAKAIWCADEYELWDKNGNWIE
jgi:hypothetical protein